jgi:type IV pilus assembly protein PilB
LVPIFVRRVRGQGETLYLAMDNPEDENAKSEVSKYSGLPVRSMIAPPADIRGAIRAYYGGGREDETTEPGQELVGEEPATTRVVVREETATPTPEEPGPSIEIHSEKVLEPRAQSAASLKQQAPPKPDTLPPDSGPNISARDVAIPRPKRGKRGRMITVTLLDGTQVNLPARRRQRGSEPPESSHTDELTARDLVAALRAISHGADASEILGENVKWEKLFAALLSVLLKKHLIADWEFVDEYRKI